MSSRATLVPLVTVLAVLGAACTGNSEPSTSVNEQQSQRGGTLRIALLSDVQHGFDPQKEYSGVSWEFFRCCLLRTLLSYPGKPTAEGGADLYPDLATAQPEISPDGLTWTFSMKHGLHYAPPLQDVEITAPDVIRALEREACRRCTVGGYSFYYSVIEGFDSYSSGQAETIVGLLTPDDFTLVVKLVKPAGDLGYRLAMPAAAPIPPSPIDPTAALGAAVGHDADYGRYLVASGPYMFEGAAQLDFSLPADQQQAVAGYKPGRSVVLVRNPSWKASADELRPAYPDRIETTIGGTIGDLALKVDRGVTDFVLDAAPPADQVRDYLTDPTLRDQLHTNPTDAVHYIEMNLGTPPFDDIHVRKAVNYAVDKRGMLQLRGGPIFGEIATHIMVDSLENGLLNGYDPYVTPDDSGDIQQARREMALSAYDRDHDGICDAPACGEVLTFSDVSEPYPKQLALLQQDLGMIGIHLDPHQLETSSMYARCGDPGSHWALCTATQWGKDYPDGFTFASPLFSRGAIGPGSCCNDTMTSATVPMLVDRGYPPIRLPTAEPQIRACIVLSGEPRIRCWADLDRYLMTEVVPWVPYLFDDSVVVTSVRVSSYSFDQFAGQPALDRLVVGGQATP